MTECEEDFKCPYCKGDAMATKPKDLYGACREHELLAQIIKLEIRVAELEAEPPK